MRPVLSRRLGATAGPSGLIALVALTMLALGPATAHAAKLVGGSQQRAIRRAFTRSRAERGQTIVSIRVSTVAPAWAVVRSVNSPRAGRTTPRTVALTLHSTYLHRVGRAERFGAPPAAARADLSRRFRVAVVYTGSGADAVSYQQKYTSVCQGSGPFVDTETVSVAPMSWTIRYIVDLDFVRAAETGGPGVTVAPAIAMGAGSHVSAVEQIQRQVVDNGCNGSTTTIRCHEVFRAGGPDAAGQLAFTPTGGLQVGVPTAARRTGSCDASDYTLGPSLWDSGAATATVSRLGLVGGTLPADPYAPVTVSWPGSSSAAAGGFATSPCAGDPAACLDTFHWRGTVRLTPVG